jgi:hypothetical protein
VLHQFDISCTANRPLAEISENIIRKLRLEKFVSYFFLKINFDEIMLANCLFIGAGLAQAV